jgi:hypothetical protein
VTAFTFVPLLFALIYLWDSLVALSRKLRSAVRSFLGTVPVTEADGCLPAERGTVPT